MVVFQKEHTEMWISGLTSETGIETERWQENKEDMWRETGQSSGEDQSTLSWFFSLINQCFLVQGNREWCREGGREAKRKFTGSKQGILFTVFCWVVCMCSMWVHVKCLPVIVISFHLFHWGQRECLWGKWPSGQKSKLPSYDHPEV